MVPSRLVCPLVAVVEEGVACEMFERVEHGWLVELVLGFTKILTILVTIASI